VTKKKPASETGDREEGHAAPDEEEALASARDHAAEDEGDGDRDDEAGELLTPEDLAQLSSTKGLIELAKRKHLSIRKALRELRYEAELERLQRALIKLQVSVIKDGRRVAFLFEGRDAAGKGGAIARFAEHLNPRTCKIVALPKPTPVEQGQWYFQRYVRELPNPGEIRLFDRSWYNRGLVEPVMGFCTEEEHALFLRQVPEFEHMLVEDGLELVKLWFSIGKGEQRHRLAARAKDPLKRWKISPVDAKAQDLWDDFSRYLDEMLARSHAPFAPWVVVEADDKRKARLESIRHVLATLPFDGKDDAETSLAPDPEVIVRYHRGWASRL
jgi:polyphosphate kinase 2